MTNVIINCQCLSRRPVAMTSWGCLPVAHWKMVFPTSLSTMPMDHRLMITSSLDQDVKIPKQRTGAVTVELNPAWSLRRMSHMEERMCQCMLVVRGLIFSQEHLNRTQFPILWHTQLALVRARLCVIRLC